MQDTAEPGMTITLVRLETRPELNGTTAVLQRYLRKRKMWAVVLPDGAVFAVNAENMRTREMLAQLPYRKFGRPLVGHASFAELVEVRQGKHGRYLVAARDVARGTFARDVKVQVVLSPAELREVQDDFDAFKEEAVPRMMGFSGRVIFHHSHELPHYASRISSFVGKFLLDGLSETALVQDLMDYDHNAEGYLKETLERLVLFDVLYFDFWRTKLAGRFSADAVWRRMTFLLSHAFLHDDCVLSLGQFCKAQCDERRWKWYAKEVRTGCAAPICVTLGNIEDVPPWGVQSEVRSGEVAGDQCVMFSEDVRKGQPVTMDYGASYMVNHQSQLRQYRDHELRPVVDTVLGHLDARVMEAVQRHMLT